MKLRIVSGRSDWVRRLLAGCGVALAACAVPSLEPIEVEVPSDEPPARQAPPSAPASAPRAPARATSEPVAAAAAPAPAHRLPALDQEPVLSVLLARAPRVAIELGSAAKLEAAGLPTTLGPGTITVEAVSGGWRLAGDSRVARGPGLLRSGGKPIFALDALPKFGKPRRLEIAGDLAIHASGGELEVIEKVPLERYLAGVVAAEMNPKWPAQALAAQAIVARSYAAARWMERFDEPWQLHWHFGVDMAYHGWSAAAERVAQAIASTRGEVLMYRGFPVLALFNASSGGRTEAFERIKPGVFAPDGKTPIAAAMPVVEDAAALPGALGLDLAGTHGQWKADVPLPDVTKALRAWSAETKGPPFGEVEAISIAERYPDSGRVASLSIRHRLEGKTRFTTVPATEFRLAVGPVRIRSLWWERCVIASKEPGYLVIEGRGFGHGCGLSQVSAWYLATRGATPEAIVARFYPGAKIERRY